VSPIFVRPVREQLEHDRLIRFLEAKYKRKFEVGMNVGDEQAAPVKIGQSTFFPDLVLTDDRRLAGLVEVETGESVNNLEALAQWVHFARAKVPFHLYVPVQAYDAARRFCEANQARVTELWTYRALADGFDLVRLQVDTGGGVPARPAPSGKSDRPKPPAKSPPKPAKPAVKPARKKAPRPVAAAARKKAARPARPAGRGRRR
jgi:hypothetical protein